MLAVKRMMRYGLLPPRVPFMRAHHFAAAAAAITFVLLIVGGIVHGTGSSLACPDWPTCYGELMPKMVGGIFYEHSHRMLATAVGVITIGLAIVLQLRRPADRAIRVAGWCACVIVVGQGVLGGITVLYRLPTAISTAHLGTAMAFFGTLLWIAWRAWPARGGEGALAPAPPRLRSFAVATLATVYAQIVLGGLVRHTGAGLACPELPLCQGRLWPAGAHATVQLQMLHRWIALLVFLLVVALAVRTLKSGVSRRSKALALGAGLLVFVQATLGVVSVTSALGLVPVTAHLGGGALLFGALLLLVLSLPRERHVERAALRRAEQVPA